MPPPRPHDLPSRRIRQLGCLAARTLHADRGPLGHTQRDVGLIVVTEQLLLKVKLIELARTQES
jgi:hypothetical protein